MEVPARVGGVEPTAARGRRPGAERGDGAPGDRVFPAVLKAAGSHVFAQCSEGPEGWLCLCGLVGGVRSELSRTYPAITECPLFNTQRY